MLARTERNYPSTTWSHTNSNVKNSHKILMRSFPLAICLSSASSPSAKAFFLDSKMSTDVLWITSTIPMKSCTAFHGISSTTERLNFRVPTLERGIARRFRTKVNLMAMGLAKFTLTEKKMVSNDRLLELTWIVWWIQHRQTEWNLRWSRRMNNQSHFGQSVPKQFASSRIIFQSVCDEARWDRKEV